MLLGHWQVILNSPFFPLHIGAEPGRAKEESRITCMRMLRTPPFSPKSISFPEPTCLLVSTKTLSYEATHWERGIRTRDLREYRCDTLPNELLGARYRYELFHICFTSRHCTGKYELNKLTSLPMCGFMAQLVEHRTGIRGGHRFESR